MNPVVVGGAIAAVLAGPPLYSLVQNGQMDGTNALVRGLLVAAVCTVGVTYIMKLMDGYQQEWDRKERRQTLLVAIAEAEEAAQRRAEAVAQAAAAVQAQAQAKRAGQAGASGPSPGSPPNSGPNAGANTRPLS